VRWRNLTIDGAEQVPLPGYSEPATVRHFEAPEALDTRFWEVRAKSALNRVPARSRMPFRWTINPYRGCSHACTFCLEPSTPVLMADGHERPIADLDPGDEIVGTIRRGAYRRFTTTRVRDHWWTEKAAYRVVLADGTELIASGDHRFLSERGWKFVVGKMSGRRRRPHLTVGNKLMGIGALPLPARHNLDYKRGYLCGMVRGDGNLGSYSYERPGRAHGNVYRFRLALTDFEALARTQLFLLELGVQTDRFAFSAANERHRAAEAIRTQRRVDIERIEQFVSWPRDPSDEWRLGFLAGIFDAEGSRSGGVLRIANTDAAILGWTQRSLTHFGFDAVQEPPNATGCSTVRLRGGMVAQQRFVHFVDSAITRKRLLDGRAIKTAARLGVVSIEPVGVRTLVDISTGTGDFIASGVVSHNCFARPTHTYLGFDAGRDFDNEIVVKVNLPEVLRSELARPSWGREHVAMGTNTDPYQWVESRYRLMPPILEALRDARTPCSILTKSPLLTRDLELLRTFAAAGVDVSAAFSVPTLEEKAWRASEPHTPHPRKRLEAVGELNRAGIPTGILVAPLMPGINDDPRQVERILAIAGEMGAVSVGGICLHLRGDVRGVFMDWLRSYRPDLVDEYERLYARGAYAPKEVRDRLARLVRSGRQTRDWGARRMRGVAVRRAPTGPTARAAALDSQERLF